jgi:glycosyltransferase involved in cell wall biosynthesis
MKISMISEHASPLAVIAGVDAGGQNQHVADLAAAMARRGHAVTVYTRRDRPDIAERVDSGRGFHVVHVPAGPTAGLPKDELLPFMRTFGRWLIDRWLTDRGDERPDVVHAHFWMSGLAAVTASAETGVPVVLTYHALGTVKRRHQRAADTSPAQRIELERGLGLAVDRVISQCADEVGELKAMGVPGSAITVIPSGVDVNLFTPVGPAAPRRPGHGRILTVGRLVERKGFEDLIVALRDLPEVELLLAGGPAGGLAEDPEARRLREVAGRLGVAERVRLLGAVPHEAMPTYYRSADVVACTPWYEPFGLTPLEAMACGVPVVTYAVGGLADSVVDHVTGCHVPAGDVAALGVAIRRLLADPERRRRLGSAARRRAVTGYDWDLTAARLERVYAQVQARRRSLVAVPS